MADTHSGFENVQKCEQCEQCGKIDAIVDNVECPVCGICPRLCDECAAKPCVSCEAHRQGEIDNP